MQALSRQYATPFMTEDDPARTRVCWTGSA